MKVQQDRRVKKGTKGMCPMMCLLQVRDYRDFIPCMNMYICHLRVRMRCALGLLLLALCSCLPILLCVVFENFPVRVRPNLGYKKSNLDNLYPNMVVD